MEFYGIVTRGRDASNDYVKRFRVLYSSDGRHFIPYGDDKVQDRFFEGNSDSGSFVTNKFSCPFEARYVRVNPLEWNQHIGLRLDFLGCGLHEGGPSSVPTTTQASISSQINTNKISSTAPTASSISPPSMCLPLLPPVNGIVNCEQSEKQLVCSALCKDGFVFESGEAFIKRSCDTVTGSWKTGTTYPDCKVYKGTLTTSPVNKLPRKIIITQR
ncbi:hypothetical protein FSP39_017517 [Pinctada imbricata]|uniref:F5/8 type C domain-containing protein n=1 Tax=Pinctada imbricata TaxID=66713 RepID=A0AA88YKT7_PINIB|nr:hypothetical protein FSP39_017517 [Pinctada imbricata]